MTVRPLIAELDAIVALSRPSYRVIATQQGTALSPSLAIDVVGRADMGMAKADRVRVIEDDGTYRVLHMTHNEVIRGEARFSGALVGMVGTVVQQMVEGF